MQLSEPVFPVVRVEELLEFHTRDALALFAQQHRHLLAQSVLLLVVPVSEPVSLYDVQIEGIAAKPVYRLDDRQYVFLSRSDYTAMRRRPQSELESFMARHSRCLFKVLPEAQQQPPTSLPLVKRKRVDEDDDEQQRMMVVSGGDGDSGGDIYRRNSEEMVVALAMEKRNREVEREQYERELEMLREKHANELRIQKLELTVEALLSQLNVSSGVAVVSSVNGSDGMVTTTKQQQQQQQRVSITKRQWLLGNQYAQNLTRLSLQNATRWFNLFHNPELTLDRLHAACYFERVPGAPLNRQLRLIVPVTYRYSLKRIIQLLASAQNQLNEPHTQQLLEACPDAYRVVLFGGGGGLQQIPEVKHRVNCTVLAMHLQLVRHARQIKRQLADAGETWSISLCDHEVGAVQHLAPCVDLLSMHYPAACYSGMGTYLLPDMTIPAYYLQPACAAKSTSRSSTQSPATGGKSPKGSKSQKSRRTDSTQQQQQQQRHQAHSSKGMGTGNGKRCIYCGQLSRTLIQGNQYQCMHQIIKCPALALMSQNEAVILETLRRRCLVDMTPVPGKKKNKLAEHEFLVGSGARRIGAGPQADLVMELDSTTLWRYATPEELHTGQHINGLRLNTKRYVRGTRKDVSDSLSTQLSGPLFGLLDQQAQYLLSALFDAEDFTETPLRQQLYDEFDQKFMATHYDPQTKKPLRVFDDATEDGLYFSLDSAQHRSYVTEEFAKLYQMDVAQQQYFLNGPPPAQLLLMEDDQMPHHHHHHYQEGENDFY